MKNFISTCAICCTLTLALVQELQSQENMPPRIQLIHNSADAAAAAVDVYVNGVLTLDDFEYQTATPFISLTEGTITVDITAPDATDNSSPVHTQDISLSNGSTYVIVANGIVSETGYNPGRDQAPFNLFVYPLGQEGALEASNTDLLFFHGSTDAPTPVDITDNAAADGAPALFNSVDYPSFKGDEVSDDYKALVTDNYIIKLKDEVETGVSTTIDAYELNLNDFNGVNLVGEAAVVLASGFVNPEENSNGEPFGLFIYRAEGGSGAGLEIPAVPRANVQLIHNSPDAGPVDVYIENALAYEAVDFKQASPFFETFADIDITVDLRPAGSASTSNPVLSQTFVLDDENNYVILVNGLVADNDNEDDDLSYTVIDTARLEAQDPSSVDVLVHHGSADAPAVDVFESAIVEDIIISNLSYKETQGYLSLDPAAYQLEIRPTGTTDVVGSYAADISTLAGSALTIVASGLLDPLAADEDQDFGLALYTALGGDAIELQDTTLSIQEFESSGISLWPSVVNSSVNIDIPFAVNNGTLKIYNILGVEMPLSKGNIKQNMNTIDFSKLASGLYILSLDIDDKIVTTKVIKR